MEIRRIYSEMSPEIKKEPRCKVYYAFALAELSDPDGAEKILYENGGLLLPDIRECETVTLDLWRAVQRARKRANGEPENIDDNSAPSFVDFRMFSNAEWLSGGEII